MQEWKTGPQPNPHTAHSQRGNLLSLGLTAQIPNGVNFRSGNYFQTSWSTDYMFDINAKERKDWHHWGDKGEIRWVISPCPIATGEIQSLKSSRTVEKQKDEKSRRWVMVLTVNVNHTLIILDDLFQKFIATKLSKEWHGRNRLISKWKSLLTANISAITCNHQTL